MKKYIVTALIITILLLLSSYMKNDSFLNGSTNETSDNAEEIIDTSKSKKELSDITVIADINPGAFREDTKEEFFEDERYIYSFDYPQSNVIIAVYTDGSEQNVKDALNDGNIDIDDLASYNINYNSEPKLIKTIVDHACRDEILTAEALEGFYSDDNYDYYFSSIRSSYVIVYFNDGTEKEVKDALRDGSILIKDLDYFGVSYCTREKTDENNLVDIGEYVTINITNDVKAINVKRRDRKDSTTKTVLLTSEEDIEHISNALESLTLKNVNLAENTGCEFELSFLDENACVQKRVQITENTVPHISFDENYCSIEDGEFDVEFLENLFTVDNKEVVDISVIKVSETDVEERFYEDDLYIYSFGNPQSAYTSVKYADGTEQRLVEALREGNIKITDLDSFGIKYYKDPKH